MNNFTNFIFEARKNYSSDSLYMSEITNYINKVNKHIPNNVRDVIFLTKKYNLLKAEEIDEIRNASKSSLKKLSIKYNIPEDSILELWELLKDIKKNIRMLPQYQSAMEREMIELGKLSMDDLTIDLTTNAGRNAAAKMYSPLVVKIVNQYIGKSRLTKQELMSAALQGLTDAMNDWGKNGENKVAFKTYAGFRIKQQILNDINAYSHDLSGTNWYSNQQNIDNLDALSLDKMMSGEDNIELDHIGALGVEDKDMSNIESEDKNWQHIFKLIEGQFKQRDIDIFYRYFGLNGYKREKSKDIAKSYGMSEGNIRNSVINKIISFLKKDKQALKILSDIQQTYNESLISELFGMDKDTIFETLLNDDIFILLEELNRWNNKDVFKTSIESALDYISGADKVILNNMLVGNFNTIDDNFKKNKKLIILFLGLIYPTESMSRKSDVSLIEYMVEIQDLYKKYYRK